MYYKIIQRFSAEDRGKWRDFLAWRGLPLESFESVDGILRPDLFQPESVEDWRNCVNEDCKWHLITNLDYARRILRRYDNAVIVGVETGVKEDYLAKDGLLGFDILDGDSAVSLITNWGTDEEGVIDPQVSPNGLIVDLVSALALRDRLRRDFSEDPHAAKCDLWAIYRIDL